MGLQGGGFAQKPSIAFHRAAPLIWLRLPKPCHRVRHWSRPLLFQMAAPKQTLSLLLAHQFGCRHAEVALRGTGEAASIETFPTHLLQAKVFLTLLSSLSQLAANQPVNADARASAVLC